LLSLGLVLLGLELKKVDERFSGASNALVAGGVLLLASIVVPGILGSVVGLLGMALLVYGLYQLSSTATALASEAMRGPQGTSLSGGPP